MEQICDEYGEKGVDESRLVVALQGYAPLILLTWDFIIFRSRPDKESRKFDFKASIHRRSSPNAEMTQAESPDRGEIHEIQMNTEIDALDITVNTKHKLDLGLN